MKVKYDAEVDIMRIQFNDKPVSESDEEKAGIILDYDENGKVIGIEILDASQKMINPKSVEYEIEGV
ncbi:MAG: DUF2283 domain-containing protein [Ignavibacteria bacterium]|jgi:YD repeat-containing protein|nr:DUF2283 domain-containing protein [Ignavibacteria bacterium]HMT10857.1 DUF2283 domain-containing protein [Ignavibacteria bacterium]